MATFHPTASTSRSSPRPAPLPQFNWDGRYDSFRDSLWPADGGPAKNDSPLGDRIETLTPDDGWLPSRIKSHAYAADIEDYDLDSEDANDGVDEGPAVVIRYINLDAHPALAIGLLGAEVDKHHDKSTFAVRHEYDLFMEHAMSRISHPPDDTFCARFFVTGQPGIGTSFGCYYFLFRLLASGQSVFYVTSLTTVYYFSSDGVQRTNKTPEDHPAIVDALRVSWVLIDMDENSDWVPRIFNRARCVVWTSSPRPSRMNYFVNKFGAETWYMRTWSSKEIAAVTDRLAIPRDEVLKRLDVGGPVARSLWGGVPIPSRQTIDVAIQSALYGKIFTSKPSDDVFLIQPLIVIDEESGRACLQRTDYTAEFIAPHLARRTLDLAKGHSDRIQEQLAFGLGMPTTHSVAGKFLEGMMHCALTRGMPLPAVFGAGTVTETFELIGNAGSFVCAIDTTDIVTKRPLYLRPESPNFTAVDAILVTHDKLGFIQASLGSSYRYDLAVVLRNDFRTMLRIMSRLPRSAQVDVNTLGEVIYCLVGVVPQCVRGLVAEASRALAELKTFDAEKLGKELKMRDTEIAHTRLSTFRVVGYTFDYKQSFMEVVDCAGCMTAVCHMCKIR